MRTITLYTRPGCHLCEQAQEIVTAAIRGQATSVHTVNIDADPVLASRYGEYIPVVALDGNVVLVWPFTLLQARRVLSG